jgi:hypothetical protein
LSCIISLSSIVFLYYSSSLKYPQAGHPNINTHKALFEHQGIRNLFIYSQSFLVMTCHCQCQNCQYCKETYSPYIYKVLKQVHPDTGISNKAMTYSSYIYKVLKLVQPNTDIPNKTTVTYSSYIYKVLKQVHPNTSISNKATVTYSLYIYKVLNQVHPDTVRDHSNKCLQAPMNSRCTSTCRRRHMNHYETVGTHLIKRLNFVKPNRLLEIP